MSHQRLTLPDTLDAVISVPRVLKQAPYLAGILSGFAEVLSHFGSQPAGDAALMPDNAQETDSHRNEMRNLNCGHEPTLACLESGDNPEDPVKHVGGVFWVRRNPADEHVTVLTLSAYQRGVKMPCMTVRLV